MAHSTPESATSKKVYDPIHPGEILREEFLVPLEMTPYALAKCLHIPTPRVNDIVREKRGVTADTALRLSKFFGNTAQFWLNLQTHYELEIAEIKSADEIEKEISPLAICR